MADEEKTENATDFLDEMSDEGYQGPSAMVSPHPLGGIQIMIRSREEDGIQMRTSRLDIAEASILLTHLQALITMGYQTVYAQQARAFAESQENKVFVPGR